MTAVSASGLRPAPLPLFSAPALPRPDRLLARGELVVVRRGVYASAPHWRSLAPWDRYLARVHATAIVHPEALFSHESAAALWGLPLFGEPREVHILRGASGTARATAGLRVHTQSVAREITEVGGLLLTTLAETAVDHARARNNAVALAVADAALRADPMLSVEHLVATNEARVSSRGRRHARWPLHRANGLAETALESISRAAIEWLGFEEPELQVELIADDGTVDRLDFMWRARRIGGEADGEQKYDGTHGDPALAYAAEKRREARVRRRLEDLGRWGWNHVGEPAELRRILADTGLPQVRPADTAQLYALARAIGPRSGPRWS